MAILGNIRMSVQHHLNPLHVFCRLREAGVSEKTSRFVASAVERIVSPVLYWRGV